MVDERVVVDVFVAARHVEPDEVALAVLGVGEQIDVVAHERTAQRDGGDAQNAFTLLVGVRHRHCRRVVALALHAIHVYVCMRTHVQLVQAVVERTRVRLCRVHVHDANLRSLSDDEEVAGLDEEILLRVEDADDLDRSLQRDMIRDVYEHAVPDESRVQCGERVLLISRVAVQVLVDQFSMIPGGFGKALDHDARRNRADIR